MRVPKDFDMEQDGRGRRCVPSPPREGDKDGCSLSEATGDLTYALMKCLASSGKCTEVKELPCRVYFWVKFPFTLGAAQAKE